MRVSILNNLELVWRRTMIYLDNAATSWPKPEAVYVAVDKAMREWGGNPGRSGHKMSMMAGKVILDTRIVIAKLFNTPHYERIVFTLNATEGINLALKGILKPGDHVIIGGMEHNSISRPVEKLRTIGADVTKLNTSPQSGINLDELVASIKENTKLVAINHASNVTGTINPIERIGAICKEKGVYFLVDAAQTAGSIPIDIRKMKIDMLAFPGHKGLLGPQGVGGLFVGRDLILDTLKEGGTGSDSQSLLQPESSPDRYESGTPNTPGIAGLGAGIRYILQEGIEKIREKEGNLTRRMIAGLQKIPGVTIYGPDHGVERAAVISFNIDSVDPAEVALIMDQAYDIAVRSGLHCAPDAHQTTGTYNMGTVRVSFNSFNTEEEIDACLDAVTEIAEEFNPKEATDGAE